MTDGLLLLHAWPLDARMWAPQLEALDGTAVAAPSHPGFGGAPSAGPVMTMEACARNALAALDEADEGESGPGPEEGLEGVHRHHARHQKLDRRQQDREARKELRETLEARGMGFRLGYMTAQITHTADGSRLEKIVFKDGSELPVDLVVMAVGIRPNVELARKIGLQVDKAILEANGRHVLTDSWTSVGVVGGLCLVLLTGWKPFDPLFAIAVALNILWNWEAPPGSGDVYEAAYRGSKARVEIRQGKEENFRPELYVVPNASAVRDEVFSALRAKLAAVATAPSSNARIRGDAKNPGSDSSTAASAIRKGLRSPWAAFRSRAAVISMPGTRRRPACSHAAAASSRAATVS